MDFPQILNGVLMRQSLEREMELQYLEMLLEEGADVGELLDELRAEKHIPHYVREGELWAKVDAVNKAKMAARKAETSLRRAKQNLRQALK